MRVPKPGPKLATRRRRSSWYGIVGTEPRALATLLFQPKPNGLEIVYGAG